jgi:F-type H+-transporting ATPase subunit alpha
MVELLKQPAASPFPVGQEIVSIWAGTTGKMDDVPVEDIRRFESELLAYVGHNQPEFFDVLANAKALEDDMVATLEKLVGDFRKQFQTTGGEGLSSEVEVDSEKADDDKADADKAEATGDRGANEGENTSPEAADQAGDNPADES